MTLILVHDLYESGSIDIMSSFLYESGSIDIMSSWRKEDMSSFLHELAYASLCVEYAFYLKKEKNQLTCVITCDKSEKKFRKKN